LANLQKRHWVATVNPGHLTNDENHDAWWENLKQAPGLRYAVAQLECAPSTGLIHLQVYTEWTSSLRLSEMLSRASANWAPRRGSRNEARDYCRLANYHGESKGRINGPWEFGEWRPEGTVTDDMTPKQRALQYLFKGMSPTDIAHTFPDVYFTHHRAINELWNATLGHFHMEEEE